MSAKIQDAERPWLEGYDLRRQAELIRRARAAGIPDSTALGLAGWVAVKATDLPDETAAPTRARYRKLLRELGAPVPTGRKGSRSVAARVGAIPGYRKAARRRGRHGDVAALSLLEAAA